MMKKRLARLPVGVRVYAIGDIHGRADLLEQTLMKIDQIEDAYPARRTIEVFVGDYIDRGASSAGVIAQLVRRGQSREIACLKGNHEALLLEFLRDPTILTDWQSIGGRETLMSYGLKPAVSPDAIQQRELSAALAQVLPPSHHDFFTQLQLSFVCGDFFFVHAGVRPNIPLAHQREEDLLWIRNEFLEYRGHFDKVIVHGHTPVREPEVRTNRINIDTGAYATGRLTCFLFEEDRIDIV
jgi:serine/threonine protein phosphatase 1